MSMWRVFSCVVGRGCLLWPVCSVSKTLLAFALLNFVLYGGLLQVSLDFLLLHSTGKFGLGVRNEAGQRLIEFCQQNTLVIANILFQQHKRRLYTRTSPDVNTEIRLIIFFAAKHGKTIRPAKTRLGADCDSDHELHIAKLRQIKESRENH